MVGSAGGDQKNKKTTWWVRSNDGWVVWHDEPREKVSWRDITFAVEAVVLSAPRKGTPWVFNIELPFLLCNLRLRRETAANFLLQLFETKPNKPVPRVVCKTEQLTCFDVSSSDECRWRKVYLLWVAKTLWTWNTVTWLKLSCDFMPWWHFGFKQCRVRVLPMVGEISTLPALLRPNFTTFS